MNLGRHLRAIWQSRWYVLCASLIAFVLVVGIRATGDETYEAEARLILRDGAAQLDDQRPDTLVFIVRTYVARADTPPVLDAAAAGVGGGLTTDQVRNRTSLSLSPTDGTVIVRATATSGDDAAALATSMAQALATHIDEREAQERSERLAPIDEQIAGVSQVLASTPPESEQYAVAAREFQALRTARAEVELAPSSGLELLAEAEVPNDPVSPKLLRDGILAFLLTLVVAAELAALKDYVDERSDGQEARPAETPIEG